MANTFTVGTKTVVGNQRCVMGIATLTDGGTASFSVGLDYINGVMVTPKTAATGGFGTAINGSDGYLGIVSAASGDTFYVVAYGV